VEGTLEVGALEVGTLEVGKRRETLQGKLRYLRERQRGLKAKKGRGIGIRPGAKALKAITGGGMERKLRPLRAKLGLSKGERPPAETKSRLRGDGRSPLNDKRTPKA
jgi:hypothetical protein